MYSLAELTEEMEREKERLASTSLDHTDKLHILFAIARLCLARFNLTLNLDHLEEEISYHFMVISEAPPDHYYRRMSLCHLAKSLKEKSMHLLDIDSLEESIKYSVLALQMCPRGEISRFDLLHTLAFFSERSFFNAQCEVRLGRINDLVPVRARRGIRPPRREI
jgi:hypothetical protein